MSITIEDFDEEIIKKAKKYADTRNLYTLGAVVDSFEETHDKKYKSELYDILKTLLNDIDASDRRLEEWRASRKATSVGSREQGAS